MPELTIWIDQEISKMKRDMDRLMCRLCNDFDMPLLPSIRKVPFIHLSETEEHLIIKAEIPGFNPEDLDIVISDDILTIKGEMKKEFIKEGEDYEKIERRHGSFSRTIQLPCRVMIDDVKATFKKGILNVVMPKSKPEKAREVKIRIK